jgi:hypothetical protein
MGVRIVGRIKQHHQCPLPSLEGVPGGIVVECDECGRQWYSTCWGWVKKWWRIKK